MPKTETVFMCQSCGSDFPRWSGQCPACGEWNSLVDEKISNNKLQNTNKLKSQNKSINSKPQSIAQFDFKHEDRISSGIEEFDRVLGGGIISGAVVLVGGDPGIGKSTLMLQTANQVKNTLYVTGEESGKQIRLRAQRLGALSPSLKILTETSLFAIEGLIKEEKPALVIIDSIQTMFREDISSAPGSVSQVRECAAYLVQMAKSTHIPIFIVGHVTKDGGIAGPRLLEHVVDAVLYFEGDRHKQFRILRGVKNRFGSTNEIGIFEMKENGLVEVANPSEMFLQERPKNAAGSIVTAALEGTRPLLVEIQALVSPTKMAYPNRKMTGVDFNRASIVIAVLERHINLKLSNMDIYLNAAGGVETDEPAIDLAMAFAIASGYKTKPIDSKTAAVGEVGLAGEIRSVNQIEQRVKEAEKLGFNTIIIPKGNLREVKKSKINVVGVSTLQEALAGVVS